MSLQSERIQLLMQRLAGVYKLSALIVCDRVSASTSCLLQTTEI